MISFLDLPVEIRLIIYHHSLNPSEYVSAYAKITDQEPPYGPSDGPSCSFPRPYVERSTPSILLVNRQITSEALDVLYRKPLHLYGTPGAWFAMRQVDITEFISEELLQRVSPPCNFTLTTPRKELRVDSVEHLGRKKSTAKTGCRMASGCRRL